jgi:hypothetical protein
MLKNTTFQFYQLFLNSPLWGDAAGRGAFFILPSSLYRDSDNEWLRKDGVIERFFHLLNRQPQGNV